MRASDLPPEEQATYHAQIRDTLERVDALNADLTVRAERRRLDGSEFEERREAPPPVTYQQPKPAPARQEMDPETSAAWNKWADRKIRIALNKLTKTIAEAMAEHLQERFLLSRKLTNARVDEVEDRITKSEQAAVALIVELEDRLAAIEKRLPPPAPRLVRDAG